MPIIVSISLWEFRFNNVYLLMENEVIFILVAS